MVIIMKLTIKNGSLRIEFEGIEKVLCLKCVIEIPLKHIKKVSIEKPKRSWSDIRLPGTWIPRVIRAGTYYTSRGKEFWYMPRKKKPLVIELREGDYKRIILGLDDNEKWKAKIESLLKASIRSKGSHI